MLLQLERLVIPTELAIYRLVIPTELSIYRIYRILGHLLQQLERLVIPTELAIYRIPKCMCPHTPIYISYLNMCPHATIHRILVQSLRYISHILTHLVIYRP